MCKSRKYFPNFGFRMILGEKHSKIDEGHKLHLSPLLGSCVLSSTVNDVILCHQRLNDYKFFYL